MTDLVSRWSTLAGAAPASTDLGRDLLRRWSQPHRHYHGVTHLAAILDAVDLVVTDGAPVADLTAIRFAAWFHDAVYEGRPGADERASADLARATLPAIGVSQPRVDEVARLVLVTVDHRPEPDDLDGAVLSDADLAVLGSDPDTYADYLRRVRLDYAQLDDAAFRAGRIAVLRGLLAADPLFRTEPGRRRWADAAQANLRTECEKLTTLNHPG